MFYLGPQLVIGWAPRRCRSFVNKLLSVLTSVYNPFTNVENRTKNVSVHTILDALRHRHVVRVELDHDSGSRDNCIFELMPFGIIWACCDV